MNYSNLIFPVGLIMRDVANTVLLPNYGKLNKNDLETKSDGTLCTKVDKEAEERLGYALRGLVANSIVIGEESVEKDPGLLKHLKRDGVRAWIVDPLDGTKNYADNIPHFGMIISYYENGMTQAGWIFDPISSRHGRMMSCAMDDVTRINGAPVTLSQPKLDEPLTGFYSGGLHQRDTSAAQYHAIEDLGHDIEDLRCSAFEYLAMAEGTHHFKGHPGCAPWDHAAGILALQKCGYHAALVNGDPCDPAIMDEGFLVAPSDQHWDEIVQATRRAIDEPESKARYVRFPKTSQRRGTVFSCKITG